MVIVGLNVLRPNSFHESRFDDKPGINGRDELPLIRRVSAFGKAGYLLRGKVAGRAGARPYRYPLATSDKRHLGCHHGHELNVRG